MSTTINANLNHPHNYTIDDPTNAVEVMPDREHPIFSYEDLRTSALYYDRGAGGFRRLFGDVNDAPPRRAFGNSTASPSGVAALRGYYFDNQEAAHKAWQVVRAAFVCVPCGPITPGLRQVIEWARTYVDGETCIGDCPRDRLSPEELAGLAELERLEKLL